MGVVKFITKFLYQKIWGGSKCTLLPTWGFHKEIYLATIRFLQPGVPDFLKKKSKCQQNFSSSAAFFLALKPQLKVDYLI